MINTDRLQELMDAIKLLRKLAISDRAWAAGQFGQFFPQLRHKWEKKARRKEKGANRLCQTLAKECDRLKAHYQ